MNRMALGLSFVVLLGGCASTGRVPTEVAVARTPISEITDASLAHDYAAERSYRRDKDAPPKLGLALSGGGSKAAMFAHGVLNGLYNEGILQKVDIISTVSGGGYAAYWYFTKLLAADEQNFPVSNIFSDCMPGYWIDHGKNDAQLVVAMERATHPETRAHPDPRTLSMPKCGTPDHYSGQDDAYRWQAHLVRWPDVFGTTPVSPDGTPQGRPEKEIRQGLFDGLFVEPFTQMFTHKSTIPSLYQWGIERTWGLNPMPRNQADRQAWAYSNAAPVDGNTPLHVDPVKVNWRSLRALYDRSAAASSPQHIPLWIVNANSGGKTDDPKANTRQIFEMTAFGSGAEEFGYVNNIDRPPIEDLGTSVRAAAGFADAQGLTAMPRQILEFLSGIVPGGRWGVPVAVATSSGAIATPRLSDGGGAENLGLYSLLKRGVKDIIVVDTAQDVAGDMGDLCTVKKALGSAVRIDFPTLENFEKVCDGKLAYNLSDWKSPVVKGTVTWTRNGADVRQSRIWLIKAAWQQRRITDAYTDEKCGDIGYANCFLTVFYGHNSSVRIHGKNNSSGNMVFPQLPTAGTTANSSSYLFWGYRELGRDMARQLVWNGSTEELDTVSAQCYQRAVKKRAGERPYDWDDPLVADRCPTTPFITAAVKDG